VVTWFKPLQKNLGQEKVTAHPLRNAMAITLVFNGCPFERAGAMEKIVAPEL
jgi:hypothetical protein